MTNTNDFNAAAEHKNVQELDIIDLAGGHKAINFNYIDRTGNIPLSNKAHSQSIDLSGDDAFTNAVDKIKQKTIQDIKDNPQLQGLLEKETWDEDDRAEWEERVSGIVSEKVNDIDAFDTYRNNHEAQVQRATELNDLSQDIHNNTQEIEFECESMSIVEGLALQHADNHFLPEDNGTNTLKEQANYFRAAGEVTEGPAADFGGGHAYIISSATGNIIEPTHDLDDHAGGPYMKATQENYSFKDFVSGDLTPFHRSSVGGEISPPQAQMTQAVYSGGYPSAFSNTAETVQLRQGLISTGNYDALSKVQYEDDGRLSMKEAHGRIHNNPEFDTKSLTEQLKEAGHFNIENTRFTENRHEIFRAEENTTFEFAGTADEEIITVYSRDNEEVGAIQAEELDGRNVTVTNVTSFEGENMIDVTINETQETFRIDQKHMSNLPEGWRKSREQIDQAEMQSTSQEPGLVNDQQAVAEHVGQGVEPF